MIASSAANHFGGHDISFEKAPEVWLAIAKNLKDTKESHVKYGSIRNVV